MIIQNVVQVSRNICTILVAGLFNKKILQENNLFLNARKSFWLYAAYIATGFILFKHLLG
jgi:hypothetical protein